MDGPTEDFVTALPCGPLRPFIDHYVGYRISGFPPAVHRGLPSSYMTFIVSISPRIDVIAHSDPRQRPRSYRCVVGGLQASPALIAHDGHEEGVEIELTPLGSRAVLGMPAGELWDMSVEVDDVRGGLGAELWERLQHAPTWPERFAACDEVLLRRLADAEVAVELQHCWRQIVASHGTVRVGELADGTGYSRQHLAQRFRAEFGLGPKLATRLVRFSRAQSMLRSTPPFVSIASVAAACGYYDQSHLVRDVHDLAGCTPSELAAGDLPIVQDGGAGPGP